MISLVGVGVYRLVVVEVREGEERVIIVAE